jgi:hypothetical protein
VKRGRRVRCPRGVIRPPVLVGLVIVLCTAVAVAVVVIPGTPERKAPGAATAPVPVAGAYVTGGVPVTDAEIERLLASDLPDLIVRTDRLDRRREELARSLGAPPSIVAKGPALALAWERMIDALDRWTTARYYRTRSEVGPELRAATRDVSDQLAALGLGYFLEPDIYGTGTPHAVIYAYRVERVVIEQAGAAQRRVLDVRRLDNINLSYARLGKHGHVRGDSVVYLDRIEREARDKLVPLLADEPYPLGDASWRTTEAGAMVAAAAGRSARQELRAAIGSTGSDEEVLAACTRLLAATVGRHEAQHGFDDDRGEPLGDSALVAAGLDARDAALRSTRDETSAYLSQIASDPVTPHVALWHVARFAFDAGERGSPEAYAGALIVTGLGKHLHAPQATSVLDRAELARIALVLAAASGDDLRRAARGLWRELYGAPLAVVTEHAP